MAALQLRAQRAFNIHPGEGRMVSRVLLYAILLYFSNVMARTASTAIFLGEFDAKTLPYVSIAVAVVAPLVSALYLRFNNRYALSKVLIGVHVFLFLTLVILRIGLGFTTSPILAFIMPVYFGVNNSLTISSFWNLLGRIFNLRQGKRLFSLLSSGEHIATILGGFAAPFLVARFGTPNLLIIAAVFMLLTIAMLVTINRSNTATMDVVMADEPRQKRKRDGGLLKDRYVLLLVALFTLFIVGIYFVGNIFYSEVETRYTTEDEIAAYLGVFMGIFGVLSLIMQYFIAGRVLDRYGVRAMLLATPVGLFIFMSLYALVGTVGNFPAALFWIASAASMYQYILDAVDSASVNIMYQPLPAQQRTQVQTAVMGIVYPLAIGVAGVLLLLLLQVLNFNTVQLSYATLVVVLVWVGIAVSLGRAYPKRLQQALRERSFSGLAMPTPDRSSLPVFEEALASPNAAAALFALDMIEEVAPEVVPEHLPVLLTHPSAAVRLSAVQRCQEKGLSTALTSLLESVQEDPDPAVRAAALTAIAALGPDAAGNVLRGAIASGSPPLQDAALAALGSGADEAGQELALQTLAQMARDADPVLRRRAAAVLAALARPDLEPFVQELLGDADTAVRRTALEAAAHYPALWPLIAGALVDRPTRAAAVAALEAAAPQDLATLGAIFADPDTPPAVRRGLAVACGRYGGPEAQALLLEHIDDPDDAVRAQVLSALRRSGYRAGEAERPLLEARFQDEVGRVTAVVAAQAALAGLEDVALVTDALAQNLQRLTGNLFALLSFLYDPQTINRAWEVLQQPDAGDRQAYALEVIDVLLPRELKGVMLPLSQHMDPAARLAALHGTPREDRAAPAVQLELLAEAQDQQDSWLAAVLLDSLACAPGNGAVDAALASAIAATDPLQRETAVWARARRAGAGAAALDLTTVQKAAALKQVPTFAALPNEALAEVAALLVAVDVPAGQTFIHKGEQGDALYVILEGSARIHDGQRQIALSGPGEVVGEMALLDAEPRAASATAESDMRLLRLDQDPFYDLLRDQPALARGMVQVLSGRLRELGQEVLKRDDSEALLPVLPLAGAEAGSRTVALQGQMLDLQKVFVLKGVDIFRESSDAMLAELAALLEEEDITAGTAVFQRGDPGDSLYVVAAGQVRVHDNDRTFAYLGEGDVFGEMALLDAEPRSATITAVSASRLLRLDQGPFFELLEERPEVARGIITVLSRRQRQRLQRLKS